MGTWINATVQGKGEILAEVCGDVNPRQLTDGSIQAVEIGHCFVWVPIIKENAEQLSPTRETLGWKTGHLPIPKSLQVYGSAAETEWVACPFHAASLAPESAVKHAKEIWKMTLDEIKSQATPGAPKILVPTGSIRDMRAPGDNGTQKVRMP